MEQAAKDGVEEIVAKETWSFIDYKELLSQLLALGNAPKRFRAILAEMDGQMPDPKGAAALKLGIGRYILCRFSEALEVLAVSTDNKDRHYFQAMCHKSLHQYDKAAEELQRAIDRGWDETGAHLQLIELQGLAGDLDGADKALRKLQQKMGDTPEYLYVRGLVDELTGNGEAACESYVQARSVNPEHVGATFRLAYYYDLHGEEDLALELYNECIKHSPTHVSALINLAVLYEDAGKYDKAIVCLNRILTSNPNHARARLFLKDAEASKTMFYDEDKAKRIAHRNAVLDIPVTDFELSVRARNCLKKMNIRTLGDLVSTNEAQLLSYKNFGETSLKEIKDMLVAKSLYLGQGLEEDSPLSTEPQPNSLVSIGDTGVLGIPLERVEFSVRARRALQDLKIVTLGDLASKSEAELMTCRNFGQTSLNEIRQRLGEYGLELRETS